MTPPNSTPPTSNGRNPGDQPLASGSLAPNPAAPEQLLSHGILKLSQRASEGSLTLDQAIREIEPSPPLLLCSLLVLPFCQPVPTVGLSIPVGLGVAFLGLSLMLGRAVAVPGWLGRRRIPTQAFPALLRVTSGFVRWLESFLQPRAQWLFAPPLGRVWAAVLIANAICLSLPLPIPLSNAFPAASILAICLGSLKRDGLTLAAGLAAFAVTLTFLLLLALAGASFLS